MKTTTIITKLNKIIGGFTGISIVILAMVLLLPYSTFSQWQGMPVSVATNNQINFVMTIDGSMVQ